MIDNIVLKRSHSLSLWILLLLLTITILVFPTHLTLEYRPIETLYIFDNLPVFAVLFYLWLSILLLLLFSSGSKVKAHWEHLALVCVFSLGFLGFSVILLPHGRLDYMSNCAIAQIIQQSGTIALGSSTMLYFDFPASHLVISSLSSVIGLEIFHSVNFYLMLNSLVFSSLLYVLFSQLLENATAAAFSVLLMISGNQLFVRSYTFWPGALSLTLLVAFLVLLCRSHKTFWGTQQDKALTIILLVSVTTMYFQTSVLFLLILLGWFLLRRIAQKAPIAIPTICLFAVVPIAWEIYWTLFTFPTLVDFCSKIASDIAGGTLLDWAPFLLEGNIGESFPAWSNATRMFWWGLIYGLGTLLGLKRLLKAKELSPAETVEKGGLLAVIMLALVATLVSPKGERFVHFLQYAALFTVPIIVSFSLSLGSSVKKSGFTVLVILFLIFSFPTFLTSNSKICTEAFYLHETCAGEFLERSYGEGEELTVINQPGWCYRYYVPKAHFPLYFTPVTPPGRLESEDEFWNRVNTIVDGFQRGDTKYAVLLTQPKSEAKVAARYGVTTYSRWSEINCKLSDDNHRIYNNGCLQMYEPR